VKHLLIGLMALSLCSQLIAEEQTSLESRLEARFVWKQAGDNASETISLAELFDQIHEQHQIRIRLDRAVSNLMVQSIASEGDPVVYQTDQVAVYSSSPTIQMPGIQMTVAGGAYPCPTCPSTPTPISPYSVANSPIAVTSESVPLYSSQSTPVVQYPQVSVEVKASEPAPVQANGAPVIEPTQATPLKEAVEATPATPVDETAETAPVAPAVEEETDQPVPVPPEETAEVQEEKSVTIGLHEKIFEKCDIPTSYLDDSMTVEQVIRAAIAQIGTMLDVSGELDGIPSSYTHVYDWDLMVKDETVYITTKLQSNLHKIVRVYKTPQEGNFTSEELAACIQKSIRPWSWRDNIDNIVDMVKFELPDNFQFPDLSASNLKVDLSGDGDLVSVNKDNEGKESESTSSSIDPSISWAAMKAMGSLFSTGTKAFAHGMLSTTEMLHYGDPPTGTIETLPNMLIISQSRGAHQEIADLLEQLQAASVQ
tara:strand:- start:2966 stop:4411 length:1446 start_codon:yes stop_codon:yes gene_type:complete